MKEETRDKYEKELKELTAKVGAGWDHSKCPDELYHIEFKIPALKPEEKIKLAERRRSILQKIIKTVKP